MKREELVKVLFKGPVARKNITYKMKDVRANFEENMEQFSWTQILKMYKISELKKKQKSDNLIIQTLQPNV